MMSRHHTTDSREEEHGALVQVHTAIFNDDPHQLLAACSEDVDLNEQFSDVINSQHVGMTPLALACALNKVDLAGILVDNGASVDAPFASLQTTALMTSAFHGNLEAVAFLLSYGADVRKIDMQQSTALGYAFGGTRNMEVIEALLAAGIDVNQKNILGMNALLLVSGYGDDDLVRVVLDAGADPTSTNDFGHTALHLAVVGKKDQLGLLKRCGSADAAAADRSLNRRNLDLAMREWARLHRDTAGTGDEEALARVGSFMMSIGQNLDDDDAVDGDDQAAMTRRVEAVWKCRQEKLRAAKETQKSSLVSTLLSCGGGRSRAVDESTKPAARPAARPVDPPPPQRAADVTDDSADLVERCTRIVRMLVDAGCRSEQTERTFGMTPLDMAIVNGDIESAAVLVSVSGADPEHLLKMFALSDLHEALCRSRHARLRELLAYDADVNVNASFSRFNLCRNVDDKTDKTEEGVTPLVVAVNINDVNAVKLLLKNNAAVNLVSASGQTALGAAAAMGHQRVAAVLLHHKAAIEQVVPAYDDATPVVIAVIMKQHRMVDFLAKRNAKVDKTLSDGSTALLKAFNSRDIEMVHHLMVADLTNNFINQDGLMYKQAVAYQNSTSRDVQAILQEVSEAAKVSETGVESDDFDDDPDTPERLPASPARSGPVPPTLRPAPPKSAPPVVTPLDLQCGYSDDESTPDEGRSGNRTSTFTDDPARPAALQQPSRPAPKYVKATPAPVNAPPTTPTFVQPPTTPTFAKAAPVKLPSPTSAYEKPASPIYERPPSPRGEQPGASPESPASPTYDTPPAAVYTKPATPGFVKPTTPGFVKPATPTFATPATPTFAKPASPTYVKPATESSVKPATESSVKPATGSSVKPLVKAQRPPRPQLRPPTANGTEESMTSQQQMTSRAAVAQPPMTSKTAIVQQQTTARPQFVKFAEPDPDPGASPPHLPLNSPPHNAPPPLPETPLPDDTPNATPAATPVKAIPTRAAPPRSPIYANVSASCTPSKTVAPPVVETRGSGKETTL